MMKEKILTILKQRNDWVSGAALCRELGVSRTAVWKHIGALREDGYHIEARSNLGYRLLQAPDVPFPGEVSAGLHTTVMGCRVEYHDQLPSTNSEAARLAREGCPEGTVVITEHQIGGRGRMARSWFAPRGRNLTFSLVLRPPVIPAQTPQATMVAAVAVAEAVRQHTGVEAGIKWPNDILVGGKKLCGILVELNAEMDRVNFMVVGVGINVNVSPGDFPAEIADTATSLQAETGRHVPRVPLLRDLLASFERWYRVWLQDGFAPVLHRWRKWCVTLNCPVTVHTLRESFTGHAVDVDETGALLVRTPDGMTQRLLAGEVTLRKA